MSTRITATAVLAMLVASACAQRPANVKHQIVYGDAIGPANVVTGQAVQAARLAVTTAASSGCRAISIGSGEGVGAEGGVANVVVLLECPATAPDIIPATGAPVP